MIGKRKVLVTTDDICPRNIEKYGHFWDELKQTHQNLRLLAFVTPFMDKDSSQHLKRGDRFSAWQQERKEWVTIGLHGLDHGFPPEFKRQFHEKRMLISESLNILTGFLPKIWSAKPPGYHYDDDSLEILRFFGCRWVFLWHDVVKDLRRGLVFRLNDVISTHTNGISADSIEKVFYRLNLEFKDCDFTNPEEIHENIITGTF